MSTFALPPEVSVEGGATPGTWTTAVYYEGTLYYSEPIPWDAKLEDIRWLTRRMPLRFDPVREPWWARAIGWALTALILGGMVRGG